MSKYIFTFWEPEEKIPAYLKLCMQTWKKYLSDYEVIILNYSNLDKYLPKDIIAKILYKKMSLPKQADCIRAWLLYTYGGFWFDADTILTSDTIVKEMQNYECAMFGNPKEKNEINIGFIYAKKSSKIIKEWALEIPNRVKKLRNIQRLKLIFKLFNKEEYKETKHWGYVGNKILDSLIKDASNDDFFVFDKYNLNIFLENDIVEQKSPEKRYVDFYFKDYNYSYSLKSNKGVICLHNSWTPEKIKYMNEKEFLNSNITLSNLLKEVLYK